MGLILPSREEAIDQAVREWERYCLQEVERFRCGLLDIDTIDGRELLKLVLDVQALRRKDVSKNQPLSMVLPRTYNVRFFSDDPWEAWENPDETSTSLCLRSGLTAFKELQKGRKVVTVAAADRSGRVTFGTERQGVVILSQSVEPTGRSAGNRGNRRTGPRMD